MQQPDRETLVAEGAMTVRDAAAFTGLGRSSLYELMDAGRLAFCKIGKARRIPRRELTRLLAESLRA